MDGKEEEYGFLDIVKLLMSKKNMAGSVMARKALCIASYEGNMKITDFLLSCGVSVNPFHGIF